jgi:hypothetical protein
MVEIEEVIKFILLFMQIPQRNRSFVEPSQELLGSLTVAIAAAQSNLDKFSTQTLPNMKTNLSIGSDNSTSRLNAVSRVFKSSGNRSKKRAFLRSKSNHSSRNPKMILASPSFCV